MERVVSAVYEKYQSYDPFVLASKMGALVTEDILGDIYAYFAKIEDMKIICLNAGMSEYQKIFVLAHCIYHAFTGAEVAIFRNGGNKNHSEKEKRGNQFAWLLLGND